MFLTCMACLLMVSLNNTSVSLNVPLVSLIVNLVNLWLATCELLGWESWLAWLASRPNSVVSILDVKTW